MVWFLHFHQGDGGGGPGLSSGYCVSKSVSVAMREMARATIRILPPPSPMRKRYGIPKIYLYCIFILFPSRFQYSSGKAREEGREG